MVRTQAAGRYEFHRAMFLAERLASSRDKGTWQSSGFDQGPVAAGVRRIRGCGSIRSRRASFKSGATWVDWKSLRGEYSISTRNSSRLGVAKRRRRNTFFQPNTISIEWDFNLQTGTTVQRGRRPGLVRAPCRPKAHHRSGTHPSRSARFVSLMRIGDRHGHGAKRRPSLH
jgi:hypothetical protein